MPYTCCSAVELVVVVILIITQECLAKNKRHHCPCKQVKLQGFSKVSAVADRHKLLVPR